MARSGNAYAPAFARFDGGVSGFSTISVILSPASVVERTP